MKKLIIISLTILSLSSFSQYFVPFGADSLWRVQNDSTYQTGINVLKVIDNKLYIMGGLFHYGGTTSLYNTAYYDTTWHSLNNGNYPDYSLSGYDIIKYKDTIYFATGMGATGAGNVPNSGYLSGWDGTQWIPNPEDIDNDVRALTVCNGLLFVGGHGIGGVSLSYMNIAAFDGTNFINVGSLSADCVSLATFNGEVYATGPFGFRKYVGGTGYEAWQIVASGDIYKLQLDTFNNFLILTYADLVDTLHTNGITFYDGFTYTNMGGTGTETAGVYKIVEYRGEYYGRSGINDSIVKWDDTNKTWLTNPIGLNMAVIDLVVYDDMLYIGGIPDGSYWGCMDSTDYGIARYYIPPDSASACAYLKPRVQAHTDTFFVNQTAQLCNNNKYANSWQWDFGDSTTDTVQNPEHIFTQTGTYTVSVTVTHNTCTKTATKDITVVLGAGIEETAKQESGFKVYPNPTKSLLFVEVKGEREKLKGETVQIIDINGKTVKSTVIASGAWQSVQTDSHEQSSRYDVLSLDVSSLPKGTYFVKIGNQTQQFIKE